MKFILVFSTIALQLSVCSLAVAQTSPTLPIQSNAAAKAAIASVVKDARSQIMAVAGPGGAASLSSQQRSAIHAIVETARTNALAAGATRRQVQEIREAVRAKVAVVHH